MATLAMADGAQQGAPAKDALFNLPPGAHQCWYPLLLSSQLPVGKVFGRDVGDGRVVAYRGEDGVARAYSAYCKHMGADLSFGGEVLGNNIRCPFHHWQFGGDGQCQKIASGDAIPPGTNLFQFPLKEQFGLIWIFFGEKPLYELQGFEGFNEETHVARSYEAALSGRLDCEPWMFTTNIFDFVHLKFLHNVETNNSGIEVLDPYRYRMTWDASLGDKAEGGWRPEIQVYGMNSIRTMGTQDGRLKWYIAASTPCGREGLKFFYTFITTRDDDSEAFCDRMAQLHASIQNEDLPVINNMRYGNFHLVKSDQAMMQFLRTVPKYPRTSMKELEKAANPPRATVSQMSA